MGDSNSVEDLDVLVLDSIDEFYTELVPRLDSVKDEFKKIVISNGYKWVDPSISLPVFGGGMDILRFIDPENFSDLYNLDLDFKYHKSYENGLIMLLTAYTNKFFWLEKFHDMEGPNYIPKIDKKIINRLEQLMQSVDIENLMLNMSEGHVMKLPESLTLLFPERQKISDFVSSILKKLYGEVLPLINLAAQPIFEANDDMIKLLKDYYGFTFNFNIEKYFTSWAFEEDHIKYGYEVELDVLTNFMQRRQLDVVRCISSFNQENYRFIIESSSNPLYRDLKGLFIKGTDVFNQMYEFGLIDKDGNTKSNITNSIYFPGKMENGNYQLIIDIQLKG